MATIRSTLLPNDAAAIAAIERGFTTERVIDVRTSAHGLALAERRLPAPLTKTFPLEDLDDPVRPWDASWVAEEAGRVVGFAATGFQEWNRRLVLWHLYVDTPARGRGVARALVDTALAQGAGVGALHLWLETSSLNVPGVAAYQRLGFSLCGADVTLYDGTPAAGEAALFFARAIPPAPSGPAG